MSRQKTARAPGAYYMRMRDAYTVFVFKTDKRQHVESSHIVRNYADFELLFPDAFSNVRALHRFISQERRRRKRRGTIADRMSVEICRIKQPVWKARSKSRSPSPPRRDTAPDAEDEDPGIDKNRDTK